MKPDELVPLKSVLTELGVSRSTLWRALKCDIAVMPKPVRQGRRLYWKRSEIAALDAGLDAYGGRAAFERAKTGAEVAAKLRRSRDRQKRTRTARRAERPPADPRQIELFPQPPQGRCAD